jgi:hypothetical protein
MLTGDLAHWVSRAAAGWAVTGVTAAVSVGGSETNEAAD